LNFTTTPRRHPDAVYKLVDGEALIVVPGSTAEHLVLNETGARVWELLDGENDLDSIRSTLTAEFEVDDTEAGRDLLEILEDLHKHGALADSRT
jgi:hypothetical protein